MSATQFRWCAANRPRPLKTIGIREISWETDCLEAEMRTRRLPGTCRYHRECIPPSWYVNAYGACPLPAGGDTANPPPRPASGLLPRPTGAGAVHGDTQGENCPGVTRDSRPSGADGSGSHLVLPDRDQDRSPRRRTIGRRPTNNAHNRRLPPELSGILVILHTER
jgi:hypothetical protein